MTEQGAKYIILQHVGGFGLEKFSIEEDMQKEMSDTFLTWGWSDMKKSVKKSRRKTQKRRRLEITD